LSLDTQRAEKAASRQQQQPADKRRRSSIEVATLTASHLGSMIGRSSALSPHHIQSRSFTVIRIKHYTSVSFFYLKREEYGSKT
jgi:hypothetical protein